MSDQHPQRIGERYSVVRLLGEGGMGAVYEAVDATTGLQVAVKVISEERAQKQKDVARFEREAKTAGAIHSPHIVEVLDSGVDAAQGVPYLVMELLEGEDMSALIRRLGALPVDLVVRMGAQAAKGLASAHAAHIVHRDVKPANLFLAKAPGGRRVVKVVDFGIAKIKGDGVRAEGQTKSLTRSGSMLGSPLYMSPEQARGRKTIDERTDVWSLGVVLYHALAGSPPHEDTEELGELIIRICSEPSEPIQERAPWVPPELAAIVHRALRFAPNERFPSALEMHAALAALLPDDGHIDEAALGAVGDAERARVAPRLGGTIPDAPAPRLRVTSGSSTANTSISASSATTASTEGRASTLSASAGPSSSRAPEAHAAPSSSAAPPPSFVRRAAPFAIVALLAGAIFAVRELRPGAAPPPAPAASAPPAASASASAIRTARLVVIPTDATVEVDGVAAKNEHGVVALRGAVGTVLRVRARAGDAETTSEIVISDSGPVPAKIEVERPAPPAAASASASASAPSSAPSPSPARPKAKPPVEIRTQR